MKCPACQHEFGVTEGVTVAVNGSANSSSDPDPISLSSNPQASLLSEPRARVRGPNKQYSAAFEAAWLQYGRKQEKEESFFRWRIVAPTVGGEETLLRLLLVAFAWQAREWGPEGWKFAPYFHRYLKRRKWEDERPPEPVRLPPLPRPSHLTAATDRKVAEYRAAQARTVTPAELAAIADLRRAAK
jgi:hypothetical protein